MNRTLYTIIIALISVFTFAQTTLITGKVVIDDGVIGQDAVDHIMITNEMTNAKTFTNDRGMFSIKASVGDELVFTHDFYKERSLKLTVDILTKGMITVHLNIETIELAEARINTLNKDWKKNVKVEKTSVTKLYEGLGLNPNMQYHKVNPNASSMLNSNGLMDPTQWISIITGQKKKAKQQDLYFKRVDKIKSLENYFTRNYFIDNLEIPEGKVTDFVTYCYSNFELEKLVKENRYDKIIEILEEQAPKYLGMIAK